MKRAHIDRKPSARPERIYLSPPDLGGDEITFIKEAFESNWVAPAGPFLKEFEEAVAARIGVTSAVALSSGTAALHLAVRLLGVERGDLVLCPTFTFVGTVNPVLYQGAVPIFIDSETESWNIDPDLLGEELSEGARTGTLPKAVIVADIFGQSADYDRIIELCEEYEVPIIEDAAEALGATYRGRPVGQFGDVGIFSFNGNKIITTSNGGMLLSNNPELAERALFLATQARDSAPHYEHSTIGYNYRLSNVLAALGLGQLQVLDLRVATRRATFEYYYRSLSDLPGISFMPEADYGRSTRWLTCILVEPEAFGTSREGLRRALEANNIEARPVWKPMHLQPVFRGCRTRGGQVSEAIFEKGLCLPSGSGLTRTQLDRIIETIRKSCANA